MEIHYLEVVSCLVNTLFVTFLLLADILLLSCIRRLSQVIYYFICVSGLYLLAQGLDSCTVV